MVTFYVPEKFNLLLTNITICYILKLIIYKRLYNFQL